MLSIEMLLVICLRTIQAGHEAGKSIVNLARSIVEFMDQVREEYHKGKGQDGSFTKEMWESTKGIKSVSHGRLQVVTHISF